MGWTQRRMTLGVFSLRPVLLGLARNTDEMT